MDAGDKRSVPETPEDRDVDDPRRKRARREIDDPGQQVGHNHIDAVTQPAVRILLSAYQVNVSDPEEKGSFITTGTSDSAVVNNVNGSYINVNGDYYNVKQTTDENKCEFLLS